jgi:hypothetical protein
VIQFYRGTVMPDGSAYLGGAQDNGTYYGTSSSGSQKWEQIIDGDGGSAIFDRSNPQNVYATLPTVGFVTPLTIDDVNTARLWTGGDQIFRSTDAANSWLPASTPLTAANYGNEDSGVISANRCIAARFEYRARGVRPLV